jgi:anti-sigma regulatory factor (Ser/Thr protein kinase)
MSRGNETLLTLEFAAVPTQLQALRRQLDESLQRIDLTQTLREQLVLAVNEACMNIIQHAYQGRPGETIRLRLEVEPDRLRFLLEDDAPCIDPARVTPRDLADIRPGGLGVHFIREIMDEMRFHPCHGRGNHLELVKHLEV